MSNGSAPSGLLHVSMNAFNGNRGDQYVLIFSKPSYEDYS